MECALVYNPVAGRGRAALLAREARERLEAGGWRVREGRSEHAGHVRELAATLGREVPIVVVVGGDGTLRKAAEGALTLAARPTLGFLPLGNANVMARELRIPLRTADAVEVLLAREERALDVLEANGRVVLAMVGVGYDARVVRMVGAARQRPWLGKWYRVHADSLYAATGAAALFEWDPPRFEVRADGNRLAGRYCAAVLSNVETYGKGWAVTPGADPTDGLIDFQARKRCVAPCGALALAASSMRARVPNWLADYGRASQLELQSDRPLVWQADGDLMEAAQRLVVRVRPQAIRVLAPPARALAGLPAAG
ncbi:MAG: diacylglycerol kinase family protein [Planctomycetota bacterium]